MNLKVIFFSIFISVAFLTTIVESRITHAKETTKFSSAEDIALIFYKTANIRPPFKDWAKKSDDFRYKSVTEAPNYIEEENQRLLKKWVGLDKTGTIITTQLSTKIIVKPENKKNEFEKTSYQLKILLNNPEKMYLPFKYRDMNFAIIASNIQDVLAHKIEESGADFVIKNLGINQEENVDIELGIQPYKAYTKSPETIDELDQWILMGKIVTMKMISKNSKVVLWHYSAPWYMSPKKQELNDVFEKRREQVKNSHEEPVY